MRETQLKRLNHLYPSERPELICLTDGQGVVPSNEDARKALR